MNNLIAVAERLRVVKRAHEDYLFRAFVDEWIIGPLLLDRLAADLGASGPSRDRDCRSVQDMTSRADEE